MSDVVEIKIMGLDELQRKLEAMKLNVAQKVLKETLLTVGHELAEKLFENAPRSERLVDSPGWLASHFGAMLKVHQGDIAAAVYVGGKHVDYPRRGHHMRNRKHPVEGSTIDVPSVIRFLEYSINGREPAHPFMVSTWDGFKDTAMEHIISDLKQTIESSVK